MWRKSKTRCPTGFFVCCMLFEPKIHKNWHFLYILSIVRPPIQFKAGVNPELLRGNCTKKTKITIFDSAATFLGVLGPKIVQFWPNQPENYENLPKNTPKIPKFCLNSIIFHTEVLTVFFQFWHIIIAMIGERKVDMVYR